MTWSRIPVVFIVLVLFYYLPVRVLVLIVQVQVKYILVQVQHCTRTKECDTTHFTKSDLGGAYVRENKMMT